MPTAAQAIEDVGLTPDVKCVYRQASVGVAFAAVAIVGRFLGVAWIDIVAVATAIVGMLITGLAVVRRPKDSVVQVLAAATSLLAYFATNPAWDAVRVMMAVMAGIAAAAAALVWLPRTVQRLAVSVFVLYHFCGILSAITSPHPMPWLTAQL